MPVGGRGEGQTPSNVKLKASRTAIFQNGQPTDSHA